MSVPEAAVVQLPLYPRLSLVPHYRKLDCQCNRDAIQCAWQDAPANHTDPGIRLDQPPCSATWNSTIEMVRDRFGFLGFAALFDHKKLFRNVVIPEKLRRFCPSVLPHSQTIEELATSIDSRLRWKRLFIKAVPPSSEISRQEIHARHGMPFSDSHFAMRWTRDHLLVALNLYTKLPFGRFDKSNTLVVEIAKRLQRTPSSLAMKLSNFASLDPFHIARGVKGLQNVSILDRNMWTQFSEQRNELAPESEIIFRRLFTDEDVDDVEVIHGKGVVITTEHAPQGPTEFIASTRVRRGQQFFRQAVLNCFENRCGVTGIAFRSWLVASHIDPWSMNESERLNPNNGLCLSRLHDIAFEKGLTTFDEDYRLVASQALCDHFTNEAVRMHFQQYVGRRLLFSAALPPPSADLLARHRERFAS